MATALTLTLDNSESVLDKIRLEVVFDVLLGLTEECDIPLSSLQDATYTISLPDETPPDGITQPLYDNLTKVSAEQVSYSPQQNTQIGWLTFNGMESDVTDGAFADTYIAVDLDDAVTQFLAAFPTADRDAITVNTYAVVVGRDVRLV